MGWAKNTSKYFSGASDIVPVDLCDAEKTKNIDDFLFRLIKIQDLMGRKLFHEVLVCIGDYQDCMKKRRLIASADIWMDYRNLRNILTHEYPDCQDDMVEGVKKAVLVFNDVDIFFHNIVLLFAGTAFVMIKHLNRTTLIFSVEYFK